MTIKHSHWTADKPDTLLTLNEDEVNHFSISQFSLKKGAQITTQLVVQKIEGFY